jgi:PKD repeat protein
MSTSTAWTKVRALGTTATLVAGLLVGTVLLAPVAGAVPGPVLTPTPDMASADALPTAQVNGVVWQQAIVGTTVYAGGSFTSARPAGAAPGTAQVTRNNLMAYDITTGVMTSFAPNLNGQVRAVTASPDGSRIYVGGDFTTVNGVTKSRIAAFSTADGSLITSFDANANATVRAIVATSDTVYAAGVFTASRSVARNRLAAFSATNGALTAWAPSANAVVNAMVMAPGGTKLIIGGAFATVNGVAQPGMTAVRATDGAVLTWQANQLIQNSGTNSAILSLTTDGTSVYGTGYRFGSGGNLEGTFRANPADGTIQWVEDCHGDTYDVSVAGGVVYTVSHAHFCGNIGGFYQTEPWSVNMRHALAFSQAATGTVDRERLGYFNFEGNPSPSLYQWFPDMTNGSFTGQTQAAWDVTANADYVVMGGEFPTVNGVGQQGLVRFAKRSASPKAQGPRVTGAAVTPRLLSLNSGSVRVSWQSNWDRDDLTLTYNVIRDNNVASPAYTVTGDSTFWYRPSLSWVDTGLTAGPHTYRIQVVDRDGNTVLGNAVSITPTTGALSAYEQKVLSDGVGQYWRLEEASGATALDSAGFTDATIGTVARSAPGAIVGDTGTATTFDGTQASRMGTTVPVPGPNTFTVEAWFRTNTGAGGKIIGFGNQAGFSSNATVPIDSTSYDRQIYMDNAGRLNFGVNNGSARVITSAATYNNNQWHHVVGTLGASGMNLYVDGARVANRSDVTSGQSYQGYWRVGGDNLANWTNRPTSNYFAGTLDEVAVYPTVLPAAAVTQHYQLGSVTAPNQTPVADFSSSVNNLAVSFNGSASADPDGSIAGYSWNWGDGTAAGAGPTPSHTYAAAGAYSVTLTVTDDDGATGTVTKSVTTSSPAPNQDPTAAFTVAGNQLSVSVDGSTSSDPDGNITGYAWAWGDGTAAGSGATATHTYATGGPYTITLTVTDNRGGANSATHDVTVVAPANQAPIAAFNSSATGRTVTVNGSGSSDPDGSVASYAWNWGDGTAAGSGVTASHTYAAAGTYQVTLTVTDDKGDTGEAIRNVTLSDALGVDTFGRTVANGWGSAQTGGAWTPSSPSKFSVNGQVGQILMSAAAQGPSAALNALSVRDQDVTLDFGVDKPATGSGVYTTVSTRRVGTSNYQFTLKFLAGGAVTVAIGRTVNGTATQLGTLTVPGLTYAAGDTIRLRFQAIGTGTTNLAVKAWKVGSAEPGAFQLTRTDTAGPQVAGSFSIQAYLSSSSTNAPVVGSFDNLTINGG